MLHHNGVNGCAARCAALALSAALWAGCTPSNCDRSEENNPLTSYADGSLIDGVYTSVAPDGQLLYFPGGMRYALEHKLPGPPRWWQLTLSFDRYGTQTGTLAQAAGNQAEVTCVDEKTLNIVNGSCSEYWLSVVAGDPAGPPATEPLGKCTAP